MLNVPYRPQCCSRTCFHLIKQIQIICPRFDFNDSIIKIYMYKLFYFGFHPLQQFSDNVFIHVPEITAPVLGRVLLRKCGNEGRHPYLDRAGQATLKFLRAAISFIPFASAAGADLSNASFIFSQPGREFVIKAGKGDWEFYFYQGYGGDIYGHCVRKPMLRYIWDGVTSAVRRVGTFLLPIMGPTLLALMAA